MKKCTKKKSICLGMFALIFVCGMLFKYIIFDIKLINVDNYIELYSNIIDLVNTIISVTTIISIFLLYKQITGEHEKARREKTLDMLMGWTTNLTPETNLAIKVVEKFDKDQCTQLYKMQTFDIDKQTFKEIKAIYSNKRQNDKCSYYKKGKCSKYKKKHDKCTGEMISLEQYYLKKLRFSIIQYLNMLETILVGWQNNIVDREIIESQFSYLYDPANNKNCLYDFRAAAGLESSYPCIDSFCIKLEKNRKKVIKKKDKIA